MREPAPHGEADNGEEKQGSEPAKRDQSVNTSQGILRLIGRSRAALRRKSIVCKRTIICHEVFSIVTFAAGCKNLR